MIYLNCDNLNSKIVIPSPVSKGGVDNFILTGADGSMITAECTDISTAPLTYELVPRDGAGFDFSGVQPGEYNMTLRFGRTKVAELLVSLRTVSDVDVYYDEEKQVTRIPDYFIPYDNITGKPVFKTVNGQRIDDGPGDVIIKGTDVTTEKVHEIVESYQYQDKAQVDKNIDDRGFETTASVDTKLKDYTPTANIKTINGQSLTDGPGNIEIQNGASNWNEITDKPDFKPVATSGSYNDLTDKPTIPTDTVTTEQLNAVKATAESKTTMAEVEGKLTEYTPTANIKTINGQTITDGPGDIEIKGDITSAEVDQRIETAVTPRNIKAIDQTELATVEIPTAGVTEERVNQMIDERGYITSQAVDERGYQVSSNIKTINGQNLTDGPGNIEIRGDITSAEVDQKINDNNANYTPTVNIKTVNGQNLTDGPGNIEISGGGGYPNFSPDISGDLQLKQHPDYGEGFVTYDGVEENKTYRLVLGDWSLLRESLTLVPPRDGINHRVIIDYTDISLDRNIKHYNVYDSYGFEPILYPDNVYIMDQVNSRNIVYLSTVTPTDEIKWKDIQASNDDNYIYIGGSGGITTGENYNILWPADTSTMLQLNPTIYIYAEVRGKLRIEVPQDTNLKSVRLPNTMGNKSLSVLGREYILPGEKVIVNIDGSSCYIDNLLSASGGVTEERVGQMIDERGYITSQAVDERGYQVAANIKTINNQNLTDGPGNIDIKEGYPRFSAGVDDILILKQHPDFGEGFVTYDGVVEDKTYTLRLEDTSLVRENMVLIPSREGINHRAVVDFSRIDPTGTIKQYVVYDTLSDSILYPNTTYIIDQINGINIVSVSTVAPSGVTEERVEQIVTSKDYQTSGQVGQMIDERDYQNSSQVYQKISEQPSETWEFELEDGSTVQKNVVMK